MVDDHLRRAERGADACDQEKSTLLRARLRAGDLGPEELRIAAAFGYAPARQLFPEVELLRPSGFGDQARALLSFEQVARALLSLARSLPDWSEDLAQQSALEAVEGWIARASRPAELEERGAESLEAARGGTTLFEEALTDATYEAWIARGFRLGLDDETCREAMANELVPWLLSEGDPVRERVAKRGAAEIRPEHRPNSG